uniref:Gustatory receptor n=1 Tax=Anopheles farauti TaxID=69004 RepID=A0A182QIA1_9DIPT
MFSIFVIYAASYSYYSGGSEALRFTGIMLTACAFYIIMIGLIFSSSVNVSKASRDIVCVLNDAVQREDDLIIKRKLLCFSQHMLYRQPILRSLFYAFDWKTLFKMGGFVVTYLVILFQFDDISES